MSLFNQISITNILLFTKHLGVMLKAGIPISEAIETISDQNTNQSFKNVLNGLYKDILNGQTLEKSLSKYPKVFNPVYISLVKTGEESGTLEESLEYLSEQLYKEHQFKQKVTSASLYPSIIMFTAFLVSAQVSLYVLPKLVGLFESMDVELPLTTKILLWISKVMQSYGYYIFGGIAGLFIAFKLSLKISTIKLWWEIFILKLPVIGPFIQSVEMAGICRNLGVMLKSGVPIVKSLNTVKNTTTSKVFKKYIGDIENAASKGTSITNELNLDKYKYFPTLAKKMIGIGEKTGKLDESLIYLGEYFENEVDTTVKNLSTIIEPILLFVIGAIVGFLALAIVSPIYKFTGSIHR